MSRTLGSNGPEVSSIGLGCMGMSEFYGSHDDVKSIAAIHRALELGITFLDTADMYGVGKNEELVGRAIKGKRGQVFLATKFGNVRDRDGKFLGMNGKPEYVRSACEASLRRLGVETIDLYYQHRVDPDTPIEETVGEMARMVEEGKVRYLGLSEAGSTTIRRAEATHHITALQTEYSLWTRDVEPEILPLCRELGIGFVAYSPLGRGFLTARIKRVEDLEEGDYRRMSPRFQPENMKRNLAFLQRLEGIASEKHCTTGQLALAWLLAQGPDVVPIPGTKRKEFVEQNAAAAAIELSPADMKRIDEAAPRGVTAGTRYPEQGMRSVNR
jgi:aryl-alcohol dehydrogenase-like predicted oxidoreductase